MSKAGKIVRLAKSFLRQEPTPHQMNVLPSYDCNLRCSYCNQYGDRSRKMDFASFKAVVEKAEELRAGYFNFTGGEPLMWQYLIESVAYLSQKNIGSHVTSNGFLLDDRMVTELGSAGLDSICISLDGISNIEKSEKSLARHEHDLTERLHYLRKNHHVIIEINSVVNAANADQVPLLLDFAKRNKFFLSLGIEVPTIGTRQQEHTNYMKKELSEAKKDEKWFLIDPTEYADMPVFDCFMAKKKTLSIGPDLKIQYCFKTKKTAGSILEFSQRDYPAYLEELRKHIGWCNPQCASKCAYMGQYYLKHPGALIKMLYKEILVQQKARMG
ncbi:MAG: radical SAM protein [Candidatus Woesearchaeota archaeon]